MPYLRGKPQGIDGIAEDGTGNFYIIEAKGGSAQLGTTAHSGQQMSRAWIDSRIEKLKDEGEDDLAKKLTDAVDSSPPKLYGMVSRTQIDAAGNVADPVFEVRHWNEIGDSTWIP